ncbi:hypothetical protein DOJK_00670 [Patescibacteria group bacterium]|nr:methyltransferase domain-containing protein [Candidatus Dojkabacteria bacterium]CAG1020948.1 hypothetical protein DOJK_00670 [Patescibacteria group bacterium]
MNTTSYKYVNFKRLKEIHSREDIFNFVLRMRLRNYESCSESERKEINSIFTTGIEILRNSLTKSEEEFDEAVQFVVSKVFKKEDPTFWFNNFTHQYRSEVKIQMEYDKIKPYLVGNKIVDIGSGSGRLAAKFAENDYEVYTADIIDYRADIAKDLPFALIDDNSKIAYGDKIADNSLVILSFHHMDNKTFESTIAELKRISNRIIVKEDVFGIPMDNKQFKEIVDLDPLLQEFCKFSLQDQFMILMLSDYVSNVFIHGRTDMSFAFEFKSIPEWRKIFNSDGLKLVDEYLVGFKRGKFSGSCHAYFVVDVI